MQGTSSLCPVCEGCFVESHPLKGGLGYLVLSLQTSFPSLQLSQLSPCSTLHTFSLPSYSFFLSFPSLSRLGLPTSCKKITKEKCCVVDSLSSDENCNACRPFFHNSYKPFSPSTSSGLKEQRIETSEIVVDV